MVTGPDGLTGRVVTRIRGEQQPGEVRVVVGGIPNYYIAYAPEPLDRGAAVLVVHHRGSRQVDVVPWDMPGAGDPAPGLTHSDNNPDTRSERS